MTEHHKHTGETPKAPDDAFLGDVRQALDKSCDRLDGHTLSRLNAIRHAAMEHGEEHRRGPGRVLLSPFGGFATACVLVVVVSLFYRQPEPPAQNVPANRSAVEDLDILTSAESLELYENLEFYQWLEENEASA